MTIVTMTIATVTSDDGYSDDDYGNYDYSDDGYGDYMTIATILIAFSSKRAAGSPIATCPVNYPSQPLSRSAICGRRSFRIALL